MFPYKNTLLPDAWHVRLAVPFTWNPNGHRNIAVCPNLVPSTRTVRCIPDTETGSQCTAIYRNQIMYVKLDLMGDVTLVNLIPATCTVKLFVTPRGVAQVNVPESWGFA